MARCFKKSGVNIYKPGERGEEAVAPDNGGLRRMNYAEDKVGGGGERDEKGSPREADLLR